MLNELAVRTAHELALLEALLADPGAWRGKPFHLLALRPELFAERADALCDAFERARDLEAEQALMVIALLIASLPADHFQSLGARLLVLLNSRKVAVRRPVRFVMTPQFIPDTSFGGFGLLDAVPQLYVRLGDLGEPARALIEAMGALADWPPALKDARSRLP